MKAKLSELTIKGIILRIIRRVNLFDSVSQKIMFHMVTNQAWRETLNKFYSELNFDEKSVFHTIFYKTFKHDKVNTLEGIWIVQFLNSQIKLPFRKEKSWLDWENAISIAGHDVDVKQTYETLLKSKYRPAVFFDVGANYGTHSLLFLAQGVKTVSFEPNPICKKEFDEFCRLNNLSGRMESVAVGEQNGLVDFWFPEKETWFGTILETTKDNLQRFDLQKLQVPLISLDDYVARSKLSPDLIKIDTEGNEISVIKGTAETIKTAKPLIIFESNQLSNKEELWKVFETMDYIVCTLPLLSQKQIIPLTLEEFKIVSDFNFLALPKNHQFLSDASNFQS